MKRLAFALVVVLLALLASRQELAAASAPNAAIQAAGKVLARLETSSPPNYSNEGFLDRSGLAEATIGVMRAMVTPTSTPADWCPLIQSVIDNDPRWFDGRINPNPARDAFVNDWVKVARKAECVVTLT